MSYTLTEWLARAPAATSSGSTTPALHVSAATMHASAPDAAAGVPSVPARAAAALDAWQAVMAGAQASWYAEFTVSCVCESIMPLSYM